MASLESLVRDAKEICAVAAPTGKEEVRAGLVFRRLTERGVPTRIDAAGNVIGELDGDPALPEIALVAHLDTVFPDEGSVEVEEKAGRLLAPGIGDNSAGVAALLNLARDLPRTGLGRILLVGSVGEEGNGDLLGSRHFIGTRGPEIDAFVAVEGAMRDRIVTVATGIVRLRMTVRGPGGHSWGHFGNPSAITGAAGIVLALTALELPLEPRTTLNVGTLRAGQSVNSIAAEATLDLDLRSLDQEIVQDLRSRAVTVAREAVAEREGLDLDVEEIGSRPAGKLPDGHALLRHFQESRRESGLDPAEEIASSTDANIPLAAGIPACCVGVGIGGDVHKRSEWLQTEGLLEGYSALLLAVTRISTDPAIRRRRS